ncbi:MAG: RAMP superfamily CRISPR-associated protein [Saprospiraceae bacterium]
MNNDRRYLARFKVETSTALAVGSGLTGLLNERLIAKDANGLPYIPGTALAGIIRHQFEDHGKNIDSLFGFQAKNEGEGQGSRITFSPAILVAPDNKTILDGLRDIDENHPYFHSFKHLPERDHVRINHKGAAVKHAKFEEKLVYKGTRFVFEIELEGTDADEDLWEDILAVLHDPSFRVGAGTRKGFGALRILECQCRTFHLTKKGDLMDYLATSAELNSPILGAEPYLPKELSSNWKHYQITLTPNDFFLFGAGIPEEKINMPPKKECFFAWNTGKAVLSEEHYLIPATSIKGAIAHRLAFHWNKLSGNSIEKSGNYDTSSLEKTFDLDNALQKLDLELDISLMDYPPDSSEWRNWEQQIEAISIQGSKEWQKYSEELDDLENNQTTELYPVGEQNPAVKALMGFAKHSKKAEGARGKVIFSDIYIPQREVKKKVFNHVAIDRFTGGAIDGALFQEEVITTAEFILDIYIEKVFLENAKNASFKQAFENTLNDLCEGRLQLGGNTTKGHGTFSGKIN